PPTESSIYNLVFGEVIGMPPARRVKQVKPRFWLFLLALFAAALCMAFASQNRYMAQQAEAIEGLTRQREQIIAQNAALQRKIDFTQTDDFILREAREKLGLVLPDEILFESND
ncbi:MAG: septum formation initiator family protein, partial [Clostridiales bacterium]|nr:septum formation initiator family protein [Clostridiales bacterium]